MCLQLSKSACWRGPPKLAVLAISPEIAKLNELDQYCYNCELCQTVLVWRLRCIRTWNRISDNLLEAAETIYSEVLAELLQRGAKPRLSPEVSIRDVVEVRCILMFFDASNYSSVAQGSPWHNSMQSRVIRLGGL